MEFGLDESQAVAEAKRCLNCDARQFDVTIYTENCRECGYCFRLCGPVAMVQSDQFNSKGYRVPKIEEITRCVGCLQCFYVCPEYAIEVQEVSGGNRV